MAAFFPVMEEVTFSQTACVCLSSFIFYQGFGRGKGAYGEDNQ